MCRLFSDNRDRVTPQIVSDLLHPLLRKAEATSFCWDCVYWPWRTTTPSLSAISPTAASAGDHAPPEPPALPGSGPQGHPIRVGGMARMELTRLPAVQRPRRRPIDLPLPNALLCGRGEFICGRQWNMKGQHGMDASFGSGGACHSPCLSSSREPRPDGVADGLGRTRAALKLPSNQIARQ